uniref:ATP synthase F0 subunit 8 n=1 Tax=Archimandrita tessellata TaxID=36945 RepID=A0A2P1H6X8_ARCTE|nr:ATP synthase F0 subunit 8 [Archimandrita tessellata]
MPQMMPLSWLFLYMYFIMMLLLFSLINYFSMIPRPMMLKKPLKINSLHWKW